MSVASAPSPAQPANPTRALRPIELLLRSPKRPTSRPNYHRPGRPWETKAEAVLLRLLELPSVLFERDGTTCLVAFDEIQDVLSVPGADGKVRRWLWMMWRIMFRRGSRRPARDVGAALGPYLEFTRGHPQRSMLLAHYLWQRTARKATADEGMWVSAFGQAAADSAPLMRAIWRVLTTNERRVARALAIVSTPLYSQQTATAVGIKRASIRKALQSMVANAGVIDEDGRPRLTDPMFERWLQSRGLVPAAGEDDDAG